MRYSPEALTAFVETVACGSFSAAARRLRKSQSTISTAIAHLEADIGVTLFDRSARQPVLTAEGQRVLSYVQAILAASERLDELAVSLSGETEARLTFVLSDTLHPDVLEGLLAQFDRRFPHTEFECLVGEDDDVVDLRHGDAVIRIIVKLRCRGVDDTVILGKAGKLRFVRVEIPGQNLVRVRIRVHRREYRGKLHPG